MGQTTDTPIRSDLSETQERLKTEIDYKKSLLAAGQCALSELMKRCREAGHVYVKMGMEDCPSATCDICGHDGGWWCPESPDGLCDYSQEDGSYDEDQCRYCGQPEERK